MSRTVPVLLALFSVCIGARSQTQKLIFLQHADSLIGRVVDGEDARELIGNVVITQENTRIECDRALQFIREGRVVLTGRVVVRDDSLTMRAPRGVYYRDERRAEAFEDVRLDDGKVVLTAAYGDYHLADRTAFFHTRVRVVDSASTLIADSLKYDRTTRRSHATGNVRVDNPGDRVTIYGGRLDHDAIRQYSRMTVHPFLIQVDTSAGGKSDTLQVRARVLEALRDSTRRLVGRDSVEVVRSDLAALCQYACFYTRGDSIQFRVGPVLWYKETQVNGDSINVYLKKRKLHRLSVMGNAFAASQSDTVRRERFDQVTGDSLTMLFDADGLRRTDVEGRAISLYHLSDDSLANGLNKTSGDKIVMQFAKGKASTITVFGGVEGQYFPENMVRFREAEYAIPGFRWRKDRPLPARILPDSFPRIQ